MFLRFQIIFSLSILKIIGIQTSVVLNGLTNATFLVLYNRLLQVFETKDPRKYNVLSILSIIIIKVPHFHSSNTILQIKENYNIYLNSLKGGEAAIR